MTKKFALILALSAMSGMFFSACDDDNDHQTEESKECKNDAVQCSKTGVPQKCVDGVWVDQTACVAPQTCNAGVCGDNSGKQDCTNDAVQCSKTGVPQKCVDSKWVDQEACKGTQTCQGGVCKDAEAADECSNAKCESMTGEDYTGSVCVEDDSEMKMCGCNSNSDCKTGFECNEDEQICEEAGASEDCNPSECAAMEGDSYGGNICISDGETSDCGCNDNNDCKSGYECYKDMCVEIEDSCTDAECKDVEDGYKGNVCIGEAGSMQCGCNSVSDCKDGYQCQFGECKEVTSEGCDVEKCKAAEDDEYFGNACVDNALGDNKICGCTNNDDCKTGFACNASHVCVASTPDESCDPAKCAEVTENYAGNICVQGYEDSQVCGCNVHTDCKQGYKCNSIVYMCVKDDTEDTCDEAACAGADGNEYYGDVCIISVYGDKVCGCASNANCKSGMKCNEKGVCVEKGTETKSCSELSFSIPTVSAKKDSCKEFSSVNQLSACKWEGTEGTANYNYTLTFSCGAVVTLRPSSIASGKAGLKKNTKDTQYSITFENIASGSTANFVWQIGTDKYSTNPLKVTEANSTTSESYVATAKDTDMKGTFTLSKSGTGFVFEHGGTASNVVYLKTVTIGSGSTEPPASTCSEDVCKAASDELYLGEACVDKNGSKACGCNENTDCKTGFVCNTDSKYCVIETASCDAAKCAADTSDKYAGNVCVADPYNNKSCGCYSDTDCNANYTCNLSENVCEPSSPKPKNIELVFPNTISCDGMKSKNAEISDCKVDTSNPKLFTLTFKNGVQTVMQYSTASNGIVNLKNDGSYITLSNLTAGSNVAFIWQTTASGESKFNKNQLKIADNASTPKVENFVPTLSQKDMNGSFDMTSTATGFTMTHDGGGTNAVGLKKITVTAK